MAEHSIINSKRKNHEFVFLQKRLSRLVIPYIFWSSLYAFGQFYLGLKETVDFGPTFAWQGQYFFIILIQLTLLYPWLRKIKISSNKLILIFVSTALLYVAKFFELNIPFVFTGQAPFFYWIFYVFLAIYIARNQEEICFFLSEKTSLSAIMVLSILPCLILLEHIFISIKAPYLTVSVLIISSLMSIFFLKLDSFDNLRELERVRFAIKPLSKYSLGIFCLNPIIITFILNVNSYLGIESLISFQLPMLIFIIFRFFIATVTCMIAVQICTFIERLHLHSLVK